MYQHKPPEDVVRHEYGHIVQLKVLGVVRFALFIGLPSWQEWGNEKSYYDRPWEITADIFGGVQSREHTDSKIKRGFDYLLTSKHSVLKSWLSIYDEDE